MNRHDTDNFQFVTKKDRSTSHYTFMYKNTVYYRRNGSRILCGLYSHVL